LETYQSLLVVGPAYWYTDGVFAAPPALAIEVVCYSWMRSRWRPSTGFLNPARGNREQLGLAQDDNAENEEPWQEPWPEVNWGRIFQREERDQARHPEPESANLVEARVFSLAGGFAVFLEEDTASRSLVIDTEAEGEARVQRLPNRDIVPGMFVLLRTEGGGDYVAAVADQILGGDATRYRESQKRWKDALRSRIRAMGLFATCIRLLELGSVKADEQNVRNWVSPSNIRTRDRADFDAIMRLIGFD